MSSYRFLVELLYWSFDLYSDPTTRLGSDTVKN